MAGRLLRLAVVPVAALATLGGCDRLSGGCPQGGGASAVQFYDVAAALPDGADDEAAYVRACADETCEVWQGLIAELPSGSGAGTITDIRVPLHDVGGSRRVTATLTVELAGNGATVFDGSIEVELRSGYPYGEQCSGDDYTAFVRLTSTGVLEPFRPQA